MTSFDLGPKFNLGRILITQAAQSVLPPEDVKDALRRHSRGDWGDLDLHDLKENQRGLAHGGRLFSVFRSRNDVRFYIITEADRSVTTILLPEDY